MRNRFIESVKRNIIGVLDLIFGSSVPLSSVLEGRQNIGKSEEKDAMYVKRSEIPKDSEVIQEIMDSLGGRYFQGYELWGTRTDSRGRPKAQLFRLPPLTRIEIANEVLKKFRCVWKEESGEMNRPRRQ